METSHTFLSNAPSLKLRVANPRYFTGIELSCLIYDLTLLHDWAVLSLGRGEYAEYEFTRFFWYRKGRPVRPEHQLIVKSASLGSDLILELIIPVAVAAASVFWLVVQSLDKLSGLKDKAISRKLDIQLKAVQLRKETIELNEAIREAVERRLREHKIEIVAANPGRRDSEGGGHRERLKH